MIKLEHSFSIKIIFSDKMELRLIYFHVTMYYWMVNLNVWIFLKQKPFL